MSKHPLYFDNHATTRVDPRVLETMLPYFDQYYGNPASTTHEFGWQAKDAVDQARTALANAIGGKPSEIIFTSGATESNNLAIRGVCERPNRRGEHLITLSTEHRAVLDPIARLSQRDFDTTILDVTPADSPRAGLIDLDQFVAALRDDTLLVSIMLANNEIGVLQPLTEIAAICRPRGILLHCDATQAVGRIPVNVTQLGVDLLSFTAHKLYGPKGIGALWIRRSTPQVRLAPLFAGGGHEHGFRSGTLNVPGIVGFARAVELCLAEMPDEQPRQRRLRDRLFSGLMNSTPGVYLNGPTLETPDLRLAGNLNLGFEGIDGEALILHLKQLAVSSGSACTSASPEPSHVLRALGISDERVRSSLRFGLGRFNTADEVEQAIDLVTTVAAQLRRFGSY